MSAKEPKGGDKQPPPPIETEPEYRKEHVMEEKSAKPDRKGDRTDKNR
jgi:hypothetical protein